MCWQLHGTCVQRHSTSRNFPLRGMHPDLSLATVDKGDREGLTQPVSFVLFCHASRSLHLILSIVIWHDFFFRIGLFNSTPTGPALLIAIFGHLGTARLEHPALVNTPVLLYSQPFGLLFVGILRSNKFVIALLWYVTKSLLSSTILFTCRP